MLTLPRKNFWCHLCRCEFTTHPPDEGDVTCDKCNKTFCEEVYTSLGDSNPKEFVPYIVPYRNFSPSRIRARVHNYTYFPVAQRNEISPSFYQNLLNSTRTLLQDSFSILNITDDSQCSNLPTSKTVVESLERIVTKKENENECAICREKFALGAKLIKLPCSHVFDECCILQWLNRSNSCPTCRFQLKSDNEEIRSKRIL